MPRTRRKWVIRELLAVLAVLGGGASCSPRNVAPGGTATIPPAPTTTADPWAVPATIDAAYVDRVLAKLNHIDGDAVRSARINNALTPEFLRLESQIRATSQELELTKKLYQGGIDLKWSHVLLVPGDVSTKVLRFIKNGPECVFASVNESFAAQSDGGGFEPTSWYIGLVPQASTTDNPTHWAFVYDGHAPDGGVPSPGPC